MHKIIKLDTNTNPSDTITTTFPADMLVVRNLTGMSILIRVGALDVPISVDDCDEYVGPSESVTIPVQQVTQFAFGYGQPQLATIPADMPTTSIVKVSANEPTPTFSGMPITSVQASVTNPVSLAAGTEVGLVAGTQVTLPNGQQVTLPAGTTVDVGTMPNIAGNVNIGTMPNITGNVNISNTNIPISSIVTQQAVNVGIPNGQPGGGTLFVPPQTTLLAVMVDSQVANYSIDLYEGTSTSGKRIYSEDQRPRPYIGFIPVISSNQSLYLVLLNGGGTTTFTIYSIIGGLPVINQDVGSFSRQQPNLLGTGFAEWGSTIPASATTTLFTVSPSSDQVLVIDSMGFISNPATAANGMQLFVAVLNTSAVEIARPGHIYVPTSYTELYINGPIYVANPNQVVARSFNPGTSTPSALVTMLYHFIAR